MSPQARSLKVLLEQHEVAGEPLLEQAGAGGHVVMPVRLGAGGPVIVGTGLVQRGGEPACDQLTHGSRCDHAGSQAGQ